MKNINTPPETAYNPLAAFIAASVSGAIAVTAFLYVAWFVFEHLGAFILALIACAAFVFAGVFSIATFGVLFRSIGKKKRPIVEHDNAN